LLTQRPISPSTLNILGCCSVPGEDGKQRLQTGCIETDVGTADIKNKADTDSSDGKLGALEQAEVWRFPSRELTTHGTPDEKKGQERQLFPRAIQKYEQRKE
jgi:hypothetical protein